MVKWKRRTPPPYIKYYYSVLKTGLPEIDKLIEEVGFGNPPPSSDNGSINQKLTKDEKDDQEDRISSFPDDVLQFIISLLTLREGAATKFLSRRWRNLWVESLSSLDFNDSSLLGHTYPRDIVTVKEEEFENEARAKIRIHGLRETPLRFRRKAYKFIVNERANFIRRANRILNLRPASIIDKFTVSFPLDNGSASHIDTWMNLAAARKATKLHLNFNWSDYYDLPELLSNKYKFPVQKFGSSLKHLRLRFCVLDFPPHFQGLDSLVSVCLTECSLTSNVVPNILSNCPSLEWLSLIDCCFPYNTYLKFVGPSILLKHLYIYNFYIYIKEIELDDVNLLSFELYGFEGKLSIKNVPRLSRLVLHTKMYPRSTVEILGDVPRLETLFIRHQNRKLPNLSVFNNLKRLVFSVPEYSSNLSQVVCLLKIFPLLQQLELDMGSFLRSSTTDSTLIEESTKISMMPECTHNNLYEVVIYAFQSHPDQIELAKYLLKNAIVLEKMKIYTTCKRYNYTGKWLLSENGKLVGTKLKKVLKLLQEQARPSTKLLIERT